MSFEENILSVLFYKLCIEGQIVFKFYRLLDFLPTFRFDEILTVRLADMPPPKINESNCNNTSYIRKVCKVYHTRTYIVNLFRSEKTEEESHKSYKFVAFSRTFSQQCFAG